MKLNVEVLAEELFGVGDEEGWTNEGHWWQVVCCTRLLFLWCWQGVGGRGGRAGMRL